MKEQLCKNCGVKIKSGDQFCTECGQEAFRSSPLFKDSKPVEGQPTILFIKRKAFYPDTPLTVTRSDGSQYAQVTRQYLEEKSLKSMIRLLLPIFGSTGLNFKFVDVDGKLMGKLNGNFLGSQWRILDTSDETIISLHLAKNFRGELESQYGFHTITSPPDHIKKRFFSRITDQLNVYDSRGSLSFSVMVEGNRKNFRIESKSSIEPFFLCAVSVCIIERYWTESN